MLRPAPLPRRAYRRIAFASLAIVLFASALHAQVVVVGPIPQIGSSNPITAEPQVPRPHTRPCIVHLFDNLAFADFNPKPIAYSPPSTCPGPWSKVVFTADFTVTAGRQFDRTASFYLGHANIYYGTTAEPRKALSPSWHVERDVTDLSAIFKSSQTGQADLGNFVGVSGGVTYDGIIYANAALEFYPASWRDPAPPAPDLVIPVNGPGGDAGTLATSSDQITQTLELPTNVERAYLDVIAQSQSSDEFWYLCVSNDQTSNLQSCGNTAFRETEITIDGKAAGVAPVYPWIYTGGIDPYLWEPIPGVQTLNFKPYRVDLTPFAAMLSDGSEHTIGVSVYNADSYFLATANLLVYTDHHQKKVTGALLSNTVSAAPVPVVTEKISTTSAGSTGSVVVSSRRKFHLRGFVNTSHGRVETSVDQSVSFLSTQQFNVNANTDIQNAEQLTTVDSRTTTRDGFLSLTTDRQVSYPLILKYSFLVNPDGSFVQTVRSDQKDLMSESNSIDGFDLYDTSLNNEVHAVDTLKFDTTGALIGPFGSQTTQTYRAADSLGQCYDRTLTADAQKLTTVTNDPHCHR